VADEPHPERHPHRRGELDEQGDADRDAGDRLEVERLQQQVRGDAVDREHGQLPRPDAHGLRAHHQHEDEQDNRRGALPDL
jgi:hypothetical protein